MKQPSYHSLFLPFIGPLFYPFMNKTPEVVGCFLVSMIVFLGSTVSTVLWHYAPYGFPFFMQEAVSLLQAVNYLVIVLIYLILFSCAYADVWLISKQKICSFCFSSNFCTNALINHPSSMLATKLKENIDLKELLDTKTKEYLRKTNNLSK